MAQINTKKKIIIALSSLFVFSEWVFGVLAQRLTGDAWGVSSFISIVLVALFMLLFAERSLEYAFTQTALVFTVCADYFLVLNGAEKKLLAMIFFSLTQLFYAARIFLKTRNTRLNLPHLAVRISVSLIAVMLTVFVLGKDTDALSLVSVFYYAHLLTNVVFAFLVKGETPLFSVGLLLFSLCDLFVGFGMLDSYLPVADGSFVDRLNKIPLNMAWVFYTPSQTLLGLSLLPKKMKK